MSCLLNGLHIHASGLPYLLHGRRRILRHQWISLMIGHGTLGLGIANGARAKSTLLHQTRFAAQIHCINYNALQNLMLERYFDLWIVI